MKFTKEKLEQTFRVWASTSNIGIVNLIWFFNYNCLFLFNNNSLNLYKD